MVTSSRPSRRGMRRRAQSSKIHATGICILLAVAVVALGVLLTPTISLFEVSFTSPPPPATVSSSSSWLDSLFSVPVAEPVVEKISKKSTKNVKISENVEKVSGFFSKFGNKVFDLNVPRFHLNGNVEGVIDRSLIAMGIKKAPVVHVSVARRWWNHAYYCVRYFSVINVPLQLLLLCANFIRLALYIPFKTLTIGFNTLFFIVCWSWASVTFVLFPLQFLKLVMTILWTMASQSTNVEYDCTGSVTGTVHRYIVKNGNKVPICLKSADFGYLAFFCVYISRLILSIIMFGSTYVLIVKRKLIIGRLLYTPFTRYVMPNYKATTVWACTIVLFILRLVPRTAFVEPYIIGFFAFLRTDVVKLLEKPWDYVVYVACFLDSYIPIVQKSIEFVFFFTLHCITGTFRLVTKFFAFIGKALFPSDEGRVPLRDIDTLLDSFNNTGTTMISSSSSTSESITATDKSKGSTSTVLPTPTGAISIEEVSATDSAITLSTSSSVKPLSSLPIEKIPQAVLSNEFDFADEVSKYSETVRVNQIVGGCFKFLFDEEASKSMPDIISYDTFVVLLNAFNVDLETYVEANVSALRKTPDIALVHLTRWKGKKTLGKNEITPTSLKDALEIVAKLRYNEPLRFADFIVGGDIAGSSRDRISSNFVQNEHLDWADATDEDDATTIGTPTDDYINVTSNLPYTSEGGFFENSPRHRNNKERSITHINDVIYARTPAGESSDWTASLPADIRQAARESGARSLAEFNFRQQLPYMKPKYYVKGGPDGNMIFGAYLVQTLDGLLVTQLEPLYDQNEGLRLFEQQESNPATRRSTQGITSPHTEESTGTFDTASDRRDDAAEVSSVFADSSEYSNSIVERFVEITGNTADNANAPGIEGNNQNAGIKPTDRSRNHPMPARNERTSKNVGTKKEQADLDHNGTRGKGKARQKSDRNETESTTTHRSSKSSSKADFILTHTRVGKDELKRVKNMVYADLPTTVEMLNATAVPAHNYGKEGTFAIRSRLNNSVQEIRHEFETRDISNVRYKKKQKDGYCYLKLVDESHHEMMKKELKLCPPLFDFMEYVKTHNIEIKEREIKMHGNFLHVEEKLPTSDKTNTSLLLRRLAITKKFFIGLEIVEADNVPMDNCNVLKELIHQYYIHKHGYSHWWLIAELIGSIVISLLCYDFLHYWLISPFLFLGLQYAYRIYLRKKELTNALFKIVDKYDHQYVIKDMELRVDLPMHWHFVAPRHQRPNWTKESYFKLNFGDNILTRSLTAFLISLGPALNVHLNTYSESNFRRRMQVINREVLRVSHIEKCITPVTLTSKYADEFAVPDTFNSDVVKDLEKHLQMTLPDQKKPIFTGHKVNYTVYASILARIYSSIPLLSVVLDVGSNPSYVPLQGYVACTPVIDSKDVSRKSSALKAKLNNEVKGAYATCTTKDYLRVNTRCTHIIFNFVHDIPLPSVFLKARELGATDVYMCVTASSNLILHGHSIFTLLEQSYTLVDGKIHANFCETELPYVHSHYNYLAPLFYEEIALPDNEFYYRTVKHNIGGVIILHFGFSPHRKTTAGVLRVEPQNSAMTHTIMTNFKYDTIEEKLFAKPVLITDDTYKGITLNDTRTSKTSTIEEIIDQITRVRMKAQDIDRQNIPSSVKALNTNDMRQVVESLLYPERVIKAIVREVIDNEKDFIDESCVEFLYELPLIDRLFKRILRPSNNAIDIPSQTLDLSMVLVKLCDSTVPDNHFSKWYKSMITCPSDKVAEELLRQAKDFIFTGDYSEVLKSHTPSPTTIALTRAQRARAIIRKVLDLNEYNDIIYTRNCAAELAVSDSENDEGFEADHLAEVVSFSSALSLSHRVLRSRIRVPSADSSTEEDAKYSSEGKLPYITQYKSRNYASISSMKFEERASNRKGKNYILQNRDLQIDIERRGGIDYLGTTPISLLNALIHGSDGFNNLLHVAPQFSESLLIDIESKTTLIVIWNRLLYTNGVMPMTNVDVIILIHQHDSLFLRAKLSKDDNLENFMTRYKRVNCGNLYEFIMLCYCNLKDCGDNQCWRLCLGLPRYNLQNNNDNGDMTSLYTTLLITDIINNNAALIKGGTAYNFDADSTDKVLYVDENLHCFRLDKSYITTTTYSYDIRVAGEIDFAVDGPLFSQSNDSYLTELELRYDNCIASIKRNDPWRGAIVEYLYYCKEMEIQTISSLDLYSGPYGLKEAIANEKLTVYDNSEKKTLGRSQTSVGKIGWDGYHYCDFNTTTKQYNTKERYTIIDESVLYLRERNILSLAEKLKRKLNNFSFLNTEFILVNGVPGCGKTTEIKSRNAALREEHISTLVLTATKSAALEYSEDQTSSDRRYRTYDSLFTSSIKLSADVLFCDECFMVHAGEIYLATVLSNAKKVILMGDTSQIPFTSRVLHFNLQHERISCDNIEIRNITHRVPREHLDILKPFYAEIDSTNLRATRPITLYKLNTTEPVIKDTDVIVTFTQYEKSVLKNNNPNRLVHTIHEVQGNSYESVTIVRTVLHDNTIYDSLPHIIVGISRHKKYLTYATTRTDDTLSKLIKSPSKFIKEEKQFIDITYCNKSELYAPCYIEKPLKLLTEERRLSVPESLKPLFVHRTPIPVTMIEKHYVIPQLQHNHFANITREQIQDHMDLYYERFDHDKRRLMIEENTKNIPKGIYTDTDKFARLVALEKEKPKHVKPLLHTPQPPVYRHEGGLAVEALKTRNLNPPILYFSRGMKLIDHITNKFFNIFFDTHKLKDSLQLVDYENGIWWQHWLATRNSNQVANLYNAAKDPIIKGDTYNTTIKPTAKAATNNTHNYKLAAPQVVTAQHPVLTAIQSGIALQVSYIIKSNLKRKWAINDGMTLDDISAFITNTISNTNMFKALEVDFSKYDKSQELFCLKLFLNILKKLNVPLYFLDMWEKFHITNTLTLRKEGLKTIVNYQRRSGDVFTFLGNTIIAMCALMYSYPELDRSYGGIFGGDDSLVLFPTEIVLKDNTSIITQVFNLVATIEHFPTALNFASKFIIQLGDLWYAAPDPIKAIFKLGRDDLQNHEHIELYYISFCDNYKYYGNRELCENIIPSINARYGKKLDKEVDFSIFVYFINSLLQSKSLFLKLYSIQSTAPQHLNVNLIEKLLKMLKITASVFSALNILPSTQTSDDGSSVHVNEQS